MNVEEAIGKYVLSHYGNLVLHETPEFSDKLQLWISRLRSDYPVIIQNDKISKRTLSFIKVNAIGYVAFDEKMRLNKEVTTPREKVVTNLETYLNMWRTYAESIMIAASADRIAKLPEVMTALNPIYVIMLSLFEDGYVTLDQLISDRRTKKKSIKTRQYLALLEELKLIRSHENRYVPGNLFGSIHDENPKFENLLSAAFSVILKKRYTYLREVIALSNLERIIRVGNIVYYPEIHARSALPRGQSTLTKEFSLEYGGPSIPISDMRANLHKLKRVKVIERSDSLYYGVEELRKTMIDLKNQMPSPDIVWAVAGPP